jgi:uncharacterized protein HemX
MTTIEMPMTEKSEDITTGESRAPNDTPVDANATSNSRAASAPQTISGKNPETSTAKSSQESPKSIPNKASNISPSGRLMRTTIIVYVVLLIAVIVSGIYSIRHQNKINEQLISSTTNLSEKINNLRHDQKINDLSTAIKQSTRNTETSTQELSNRISLLQQQQIKLKEQASQAEQQLQGDSHYWMRLEVQHLIRMAVHRVSLSADIDAAVAALQAADERLLEINDVTLILIRESIAQQILALEEFTTPDYVALHMRIAALRKSIKSALVDTEVDTAVNTDAQAHDSVIKVQSDTDTGDRSETQDTLIDNIISASKTLATQVIQSAQALFNDSVQVTHGQKDTAAFLQQQDNRETYEAASILLLEAQYAVTRRDNESYQNQLDAAKQVINAHAGFQQQASLVENIHSLSEINLSPELPDISQPAALLAEKIALSKASK